MIPAHKKAAYTSTAAASATGLILYFLGHYVLKGGVPDVATSWVYTLLPGALTFAAAHLATRKAPAGAPASTPVVTQGTAVAGELSPAMVAQVKQLLAAQGVAPVPGHAGAVAPGVPASGPPLTAMPPAPAPPPQPAAPASPAPA